MKERKRERIDFEVQYCFQVNYLCSGVSIKPVISP